MTLAEGLALEAARRAGGVRGRRAGRAALRRRRGPRAARALERESAGRLCVAMAYFVTGATGFIGRRLVERLLEQRQGKIYVLVRESSPGAPRGPARALEHRSRAPPRPSASSPSSATCAGRCWASSRSRSPSCAARSTHFFHLAAVYDMTAPAERNTAVNVGGTTHAVELARALDAKHLHHVSSIAVAGEYHGVFTEDMFDEGQRLPSPYHRTKFESERIVREQPYVPWRVYRPGIVVGDSQDRRDGQDRRALLLLQGDPAMRHLLPEWVPLVGLDLGYTNIVPVDWVAGALEHIAHEPDLDGRAFHLTDPRPQRVDELINELAGAAHAPRFAVSDRQTADSTPLPKWPLALATRLPPLAPAGRARAARAGHPRARCSRTWSSCRASPRSEAARALAGSPLEQPPPLHEYAARLWDYWEREMDPDLGRGRTLKEALDGQARADHRRLLGDRALDRAEGRRRRRRAAAGGAQRREARGGARRDRRRGRHRLRVRGRHLRHGVDRPAARARARRPPQRRHARQQRGPLDPPLDRAQLRPLPRLRTHDAAELLRRGQADHRPAAAHARARLGAHREHLLDRRADQPAALLRLRRLEGRARRLHARGRLGGDRRRRHVHHDPHAAGAHADDRADEDVRRLPRDQPRGGRGHDLRGAAQPPQADGHAHRQVRRSRLLALAERRRPAAAPRLPRLPRLGRLQGPDATSRSTSPSSRSRWRR